MKISLIVAMDQNGGIGLDGQLPWRLSDDLKEFKRRTMGHFLVVGRKTWESIGKPLPGRKMLVLTRQPGYEVPENVVVCGSLEEALGIAKSQGEDEIFIGGGASIYREALAIADQIYLTRVGAVVNADTFFPNLDESQWEITPLLEHSADNRNEYGFRMDLLERKDAKQKDIPLMPASFTETITFLYTPDLDRTADFYENVLGLSLVLDQGLCRIWKVNEAGYVGYCQRENAPEKPEGIILTLISDEVDEWAERLLKAGVTLEKPPTLNKDYNIYHIFFRDPNGYLLEIQRFIDPGWNQP